MDTKKTLLVIGGDLRIVYAAEKLAESFCVFAYGLNESRIPLKKTKKINDISKIGNFADFILLPLPVSRNGRDVNAPLCRNNIPLESIPKLLKENGVVFGGAFSDQALKIFKHLNIRTVDYFDDEELNIINAEATAEGALMTAIQNTDFTIFESSILITGFGRIAKTLAAMLKGIGADVTIAARKSSDLTWARIMGCKTKHTNAIDLAGYQIIFNTVPEIILTEKVLKTASDECLIIELASTPGGIDKDAAKKLSVKTIEALGLPGKTAPGTSGEMIAAAVLKERRSYE